MLSNSVRAFLLVLGFLIMLGGVGIISLGPGAGITGLWVVGFGALLIVAVVIERQRYRSEAADRSGQPVGPGGGEPIGAIDPRFRPTDEVFVDPTSGHRMRVLVDPATGERRYRAEG